ncbi:MAG TPA: hypothetical protein VMF30_18765, partial [Pirellulales bacterium]|nr:hypothetical protein [Pirellulales bacterium]
MNTAILRFAPWLIVPLTLVLAHGVATAAGELVVHEWGTFTALADDDGRQLPGINVDDEQLPGFVHNLGSNLLKNSIGITGSEHPPGPTAKGAPARHPYVTLRLETPVIYFYPPADAPQPLELDVHVDFHAGWLTEFYPQAKVAAPGLKVGNFSLEKISPQTVGSLDWQKLQVGTAGRGPQTDAPVWTTPRAVRAAAVTTPEGESEQYLFYRGVGNFAVPLRIVSRTSENTIELHAGPDDQTPKAKPLTIGPMWLVHVRPDGQTAFRAL